jgi:hypothetical protein
VNLLAFRLNLVELAYLVHLSSHVASQKQSQDLQSRMATAAPFDFDSLIPILAAHPLLLLNHNMHFLILFMLGFAANFVLMALLI